MFYGYALEFLDFEVILQKQNGQLFEVECGKSVETAGQRHAVQSDSFVQDARFLCFQFGSYRC